MGIRFGSRGCSDWHPGRHVEYIAILLAKAERDDFSVRTEIEFMDIDEAELNCRAQQRYLSQPVV